MRMTSESVLVTVSRRACIRTWIFAKLSASDRSSLRIFSILAEPLESVSRAETRSSSNWSRLTRCQKGAAVNGQTKLDAAFSRWSAYFRPCDDLIFPPWGAANSPLSARQLIFLHFFPTQPLGTGAFIRPGLAWPTSLSPHSLGWRRLCLRALLLSSLMYRTHVFSTFSISFPSTSSTFFCDFPIHHSLHTVVIPERGKVIQRAGNSPTSPLPPSISLRKHLMTRSFSPRTRGEVK
ncbi:hypothetical protein F5148DRAFT_1205344 [Russula earlei]|uniref:Uncharacterized protein n=1 Tax=Russula earlei TaxID=71964 RepID=A0ACC0U970_9AGAM|nr:hypothetical protein F5148DRAFT_1205344 [Russula earlei]